MRPSLLVLLAAAAPGCLNFDGSDGNGTSPPDAACTGGACPRPTIHLGDNVRMAAGTTLATRTSGGDALTSVEVMSSNPSIVEIEVIDDLHYKLHSHAPGAATIRARQHGTQRVLDSIEVNAASVANVEVFYRAAPGVNAPLSQLAGMLGGTDHLCVRYVDDSGNMLLGRGELTTSGAAIAVTPDDDVFPERLSESFASRSTCIGVRFVSVGTAQLTASVMMGPTVTLPIEVITEPSTVELIAMVLRNNVLVPAPDPVTVDEYVGVDLVGHTSDGRAVAGLATQWSGSNTVELVDYPTEVVLRIPQAGNAIVAGTAHGLTRTLTLHAL